MENLTALSYELRKNVIEIIRAGKAGHIGGDMSVIDTLIALYFKEMNVTPENFKDPDHDRFVMSKGHSVESLYAVLAKKGFFFGLTLASAILWTPFKDRLKEACLL